MVKTANLGFPRVGADRELKKAQEAFWKGSISEAELLKVAADLRLRHWQLQKQAGIDAIPSNDFTLYDHVLDTICMVGAVPERYGFKGGKVDTATFFAMARGSQKGMKKDECCGGHEHSHEDKKDVIAMEMTKWFDTNYHYIVPEFSKGQNFSYASTKAVDQFNEAKAKGIETRPVLVGPLTFLLLGKMKEGGNVLSLLPKLLPVYETVLKDLEKAGAKQVQIDEPALVLDLSSEAKEAYKSAYQTLSQASGLKMTLATYFGELRDNRKLALELPVSAIHVDLVRGLKQLDDVLAELPSDKTLSLGLIDGRNIWRAHLSAAIAAGKKAADKLGEARVVIAPSCSLLHTPVDLDLETGLDTELKSWLAFAKQKLSEVALVAKALNKGNVDAELQQNEKAWEARGSSKRIHNDKVKARAAAANDNDLNRKSPFSKRQAIQQKALKLPLLPTTTIGSFPQTAEVRSARARFKKGELNQKQYDEFLGQEIEKSVRFQENIDIDVLVHGEFERNDMVEYFGEQLEGFAFTKNGWVQSYGSRCVKPPVIFGDVSRPHPMTVQWSEYAQKLTKRIMKGMLTGPVTILQWSFVRDDQPRSETCRQIAFAIRDEVVDLEKAGIRVIQIDEPAIREGLPLRKSDWAEYLKWAVDAFRISAAGVADETQIHTHMCYSEFNDIIKSVADMDADVISIETSRSQMELLDAFVGFKYPNEIGPGVYDIHSPRVPSKKEMTDLLRKALKVLNPQQVWVNPDCGLKTRGWKETEAALAEMVESAKELRQELESKQVKATA